MKALFWGFVLFIALLWGIFVWFLPLGQAEEPKEPGPGDFLQFCVDTWGVTKTAECFKAQRIAVELLWEFKELRSEFVDANAYLCIDKHTYEKYNNVVDVVSAVECIVDILEGSMKKKSSMKLPRI